MMLPDIYENEKMPLSDNTFMHLTDGNEETDTFFFGSCYDDFRNNVSKIFPDGIDRESLGYKNYKETERIISQDDDQTMKKIDSFEVSRERFIDLINDSIRDGIETYSRAHSMLSKSILKKAYIEFFTEPFEPYENESREEYEIRANMPENYRMLFNADNDIGILEIEQEKLNGIKASLASNITDLCVLGLTACNQKNGEFSYFIDQNWDLSIVHEKDGLKKILSKNGSKVSDSQKPFYHQ